VAARWLRRGIDGALQLGYQFGNRTVQVVSDVAHGSPVTWLPRLHPNGLKQHGRGKVVRMGYEWHRHPRTDGLIFRADMPHPPAGPVGEDESSRDRHHEGQPNRQRAPPSFAHNSI